MAKGIEIRVTLRSGDLRYHTLPFGLRDAEISGWLDDTYGGCGWTSYTEIIKY
ncbi:hypothetical protein SAMN05192529_102114 [Arachidicoccus rhizosphaerae]|uniref:Uncharacterized protein n=1 Tax=Arachidicoccus rhizosphaerae TaxID=551991 RepID=A0A1H3W5W3_9BACT|nr:hypothetical protein [Arachidicoccus rhizosphaerae]SDZ81814.1 hypothetical protein SAMN05192529_102114 [Arachidicoccus rhizosphaerae]